MEKNSSTSNSRPVQRFLLRMVLPVVIPVAIFLWVFDGWFARHIVFQNQTTGAAKIHRIYAETHPEEIPIFGSSRAAGSYVPSEIHPHCWNYGIEKTQYGMLRIFLMQELAKPKTTPIIVNLDYAMFDEWFCDIAHLIPNAGHPEIKDFMGEHFTWSYYLPTIRYYGHFDSYFKNNLAQSSGKNLVDHGGFFLRDPYLPKEFARQVKIREKTLQRFFFEKDQILEFDSLLKSHPERDFHIVVAPYHSSYFTYFPEYGYGLRYLDHLDSIPNVKVHNFDRSPDYPDSLFKNTTHLNLKGAQKFSRELKRQIFGGE